MIKGRQMNTSVSSCVLELEVAVVDKGSNKQGTPGKDLWNDLQNHWGFLTSHCFIYNFMRKSQ